MKYFDYAATTPLDSDAAQTYVEASINYYGNTSSLHDIGSMANDLLENCRYEWAKMLGVEKDGIFFTSGGSESNNLGIHTLLTAKKKEGYHIISGVAEHSSIQNTLESLSISNYEITLLPLNKDGRIDIEELKLATRNDTVLISIQYGNSEIGTIQPVEEISKWCKNHNILFHCDGVHVFGKKDINKSVCLFDSLSISSHKFYGPKGTGAVYINPKLAWKPHYPGTTHENGFRPGTVNVPGIAAMTVAAQKLINKQIEYNNHVKELRTLLISILNQEKNLITIYSGDENHQLPHTLGLRLHGLEGQWVMLECNRLGFAISTGSACSVGLTSPSKTMVAMNIPDKIAKEFIRISFGRDTTKQDIEELSLALLKIIRHSQ